jgi:hypothetical protein
VRIDEHIDEVSTCAKEGGVVAGAVEDYIVVAIHRITLVNSSIVDSSCEHEKVSLP